MHETLFLNLPKGAQQDIFLDYLNSVLWERLLLVSSEAQYQQDGRLWNSIHLNFGGSDTDAKKVTIRFVNEVDGHLSSAEITSECTGDDEYRSIEYARTIITDVLASALAQRKNKFFVRSLFFYIGPLLDGEYWIKGCRLAPIPPNEEHPILLSTERAVTIDQNVEAIDSHHARALGEQNAVRLIARLSMILDTGFYSGSTEFRWVLPMLADGAPASDSVRLQLGFFGHDQHINEMPQKGARCHLGKYNGELKKRYRSVGDLLSLPRETRRILNALDAVNPAIAQSFDAAARLFQVSAVVGRQYPTVGLTYKVAAVEALSSVDPGAKGFSDFIRRNIDPQIKCDDVLDFLYKEVRSAHIHAGSFPMGEYGKGWVPSFFFDAEYISRNDIIDRSFDIIRSTISGWILNALLAGQEKQP